MGEISIQEKELYNNIAKIIQSAKTNLITAINITMVYAYYEIGKMIVHDQQSGKQKAQYGKQTLISLSAQLTKDFGKGYSVDNLENMRKFYSVFSISETVSRKFTLSWSHYLVLIRMKNEAERHFYEIEATQNSWTLKELKRQFDSGLFERLSLSRDKEQVTALSLQGQIISSPMDIIKDPYILEFIGLPVLNQYSESQLEQKLIDKLEHFLLELGKGFTFVARQKRITIDEQHFAVDLVFYNRLLRCFVVIDLKIGALKHQDIGQMMMYVNYFDRVEKNDDEQATIGIILCKDKSKGLVEMTLPKDNNQIYASQYLTILPNKEELAKLLEMDDE